MIYLSFIYFCFCNQINLYWLSLSINQYIYLSIYLSFFLSFFYIHYGSSYYECCIVMSLKRSRGKCLFALCIMGSGRVFIYTNFPWVEFHMPVFPATSLYPQITCRKRGRALTTSRVSLQCVFLICSVSLGLRNPPQS